MIAYLIILLFIILLVKDFNKFFPVLIILSTFLDQFKITLRNVDISIYVLISLFSFFVFINKYKQKKLLKLNDFPLKLSFSLLCVSYIISYINSYKFHFQLLFSYLLSTIINIYIFWRVIDTYPRKCIRSCIKCMIIFGTIIGVYALYETLSGQNPYIKFINSLDLYTLVGYVDQIRYGFKRSQSIFDMHAVSACVSLCLFST